jgi:hypothetical protein
MILGMQYVTGVEAWTLDPYYLDLKVMNTSNYGSSIVH